MVNLGRLGGRILAGRGGQPWRGQDLTSYSRDGLQMDHQPKLLVGEYVELPKDHMCPKGGMHEWRLKAGVCRKCDDDKFRALPRENE